MPTTRSKTGERNAVGPEEVLKTVKVKSSKRGRSKRTKQCDLSAGIPDRLTLLSHEADQTTALNLANETSVCSKSGLVLDVDSTRDDLATVESLLPSNDSSNTELKTGRGKDDTEHTETMKSPNREKLPLNDEMASPQLILNEFVELNEEERDFIRDAAKVFNLDALDSILATTPESKSAFTKVQKREAVKSSEINHSADNSTNDWFHGTAVNAINVTINDADTTNDDVTENSAFWRPWDQKTKTKSHKHLRNILSTEHVFKSEDHLPDMGVFNKDKSPPVCNNGRQYLLSNQNGAARGTESNRQIWPSSLAMQMDPRKIYPEYPSRVSDNSAFPGLRGNVCLAGQHILLYIRKLRLDNDRPVLCDIERNFETEMNRINECRAKQIMLSIHTPWTHQSIHDYFDVSLNILINATTSKLELITSSSAEKRVDEEKPLRGRRHYEKINPDAVALMEQWFQDNINNPFPTQAQKEYFSTKGRVDYSQVNNWFIRRRKKSKSRMVLDAY